MAEVTFIPPLLLFRPFQFLGDVHKKNISSVTLRNCRGVPNVKGIMTLAFTSGSNGDSISYVAVDPERECVPVSYILQDEGKVTFVLSIEYRQDDKQRWVPKSWQWDDLDFAGKLQSTSHVDV